MPWLLGAVTSGIYQGLCWTDLNRGAFRVPWKHNSRKDVTSSDREIFKVGGMGTHQKQPPGTQGGLGEGVTSLKLKVSKTGGVGGVACSYLKVFKMGGMWELATGYP